jgi:plastocyanin
MFKRLLAGIGFVVMLATGPTGLSAQPAPSPEDLTLHPGDTITWTPGPPHGVQFGGVQGVSAFTAVKAILDFGNANLPESPPGVAKGGQNVVVNATVKADAAVGAVFNFTCQVHNNMISLPFKIAAAVPGQKRDVQIVGATGPNRWVIKVDRKLGPP